MSDQLKPCPFCGGQDFDVIGEALASSVRCKGCNAGTFTVGAKHAIKFWNTRTPQTEADGLKETKAMTTDHAAELSAPLEEALRVIAESDPEPGLRADSACLALVRRGLLAKWYPPYAKRTHFYVLTDAGRAWLDDHTGTKAPAREGGEDIK